MLAGNSCRASPCRSIDSPVGLPLDNHGRSYFYYFREKTCRELSSLLPLEFWTAYVLPMSALNQHVQYAIVALAAQHRAYVEEKSGLPLGSPSTRLTYSLQTYGKAITCLNKQLFDSPSGRHILEATLVTCLLFICFNILQGNDVGALAHLDSGLQICSKNLQRIRSVSDGDETVGEPEIQLRSTFRRLDLQAASYLGSYHVKSVTNELIRNPEILHSTHKITLLEFKNFHEAGSYLDGLVLSACHYMRSTAEPLKYLDGGRLLDLRYQSAESERDMHIEKLHNWLESFRAFVSTSSMPLEETEKFLAARCRISHAATVVALFACLCPHEMAYDQCLPLFLEVLTSAEDVLRSAADVARSQDTLRPLFDLEMSLIHPLYLTALKCRDSHIRWRAKELLHICGKEGVWDGDIMARVAGHVISLEEGERGLDTISGILEIAEGGRICGTGISVNRDKKMAWVECSMRRSISKHEFSVDSQGGERDTVVPEEEIDWQYEWEVRETILEW